MDVTLKLDAWRKKVESASAKVTEPTQKSTVTKETEATRSEKPAIVEATEIIVPLDPWLAAKEKMILDLWYDASAEVKGNFLWFYRNEDRLPLIPFTLDETALTFKGYEPQQELRINDPKKFYSTIKADINIGPKGWNAVTQVLKNRIKILRNMVE